jgi:hypothetical protein
MKIKLTRGLEVIVDDEDFESLNQFKWYSQKGQGNHYYAARCEKRKTILMHRVLLNPENFYVDHINGNTLDNRKCNLRIVTNAQNIMNSKKCDKKVSSKYKGVHWHNQSQKFRVKITLNKKEIHLGYYNNEIDGAKAYNEAALKYHGKYARINKL